MVENHICNVKVDLTLNMLTIQPIKGGGVHPSILMCIICSNYFHCSIILKFYNILTKKYVYKTFLKREKLEKCQRDSNLRLTYSN